MTLEMIDRDQRNTECIAQTLRSRHADQQRADEARSGRHRDLFDIAPRGVRFVERAADQRKEMLQMFARRDLRNDAAEGAMALDLRGNQIDADRAVAVE